MSHIEDPLTGHLFRIFVQVRRPLGVGDRPADAEGSGVVDVPARDLPAALIAAAALPLSDWTGFQSGPANDPDCGDDPDDDDDWAVEFDTPEVNAFFVVPDETAARAIARLCRPGAVVIHRSPPTRWRAVDQ